MNALSSAPACPPPVPANWANGFRDGDIVIGAGGSERPFYKDGAWRLCVFEKSTGRHLVYNYSDDMLEDDPVRSGD